MPGTEGAVGFHGYLHLAFTRSIQCWRCKRMNISQKWQASGVRWAVSGIMFKSLCNRPHLGLIIRRSHNLNQGIKFSYWSAPTGKNYTYNWEEQIMCQNLLMKLVCSAMGTSPHCTGSIQFCKRLGIMFESACERPPLDFIEQEFTRPKPKKKFAIDQAPALSFKFKPN